jgi:DHA1 family tetracycline resistance protein-like MFS transporter
MSNTQRRAAAGFIFVTLFLDILGIGIIVPILPALVTEFAGGDPSAGARWFGPLIAVYALMQFIFAPVLGALSDRYGRRPVLLIALFGYGVDYLILGMAPNLFWLFVGRLLAGILGATTTTANAYMADISTPETRSRNFGLVGAAFGLGFVFGPALGGVLGEANPRLPFFVAAGLVFCNWLYGFFILPESLPPERRRTVDLAELNPFRVILRITRYPLVAGLSVAYVLFSLAQRGLEAVWVLHATLRYGWGELENGLSLAVVGIVAALNQGLLIRKVVPRLGEKRTVIVGLFISAVAFVAYGFADEAWMVFVVIPIGSLGGLAYPTLQGIVSGAVKPHEQGAIQGALAGLTALTAVIAPLIATGLFSHFTSEDAPVQMPGISFFAGALCLLGACAAAATALNRHLRPEAGGHPPGSVQPGPNSAAE